MVRFVFYFVVFLLLIFSSIIRGYAGQDVAVIKVGHVGHDHQLALYVAVDAGKGLEKDYGVYMMELKPQEVYDLYDGGRLVAHVHLIKVGGGSKMPAALEQGHIDVGLGGLGPVMKFVDKGAGIKVLAPLNNDGDALVMKIGFTSASWPDFIRELKRSDRPVKIGFKDPMANAYMIFIRALREEGIRYGQEPVDKDGRFVQVTTMNLQGEENVLPSLESGIVDGVVINEPLPSIIIHKKAGYRVANLSDLPPSGKWKGHPCCVVAAGSNSLKEKREAIKSLLKVIAAGGDLMAVDREKAFLSESKWTKTTPEVGKKSIPNVTYVVQPDESWLRGVDVWIDMMASSNQFQKNLMGKTSSEIRSAAFELSLLKEALSGINLRSLKERKN